MIGSHRTSAPSDEVVIVGAGPVGLMLGCWLRKLGVGVRILEKRATRSTQSKASSLNASSLVNLHALGIHERFDAAGQRVQDLKLYWQGRRLMRVNYRRLPSRYDHILCLSQPRTEAILEAHFLDCGGVLVRGAEVQAIHAGDEGVALDVRTTADGHQSVLSAQYVVGCDGGKSIVRQQLGFDFPGSDHGSGFVMFDACIQWPGDTRSVHYFVSDDAFVIVIPLSEGRHRIIIRTPHNEKTPLAANRLDGYQALVKQHGPQDLLIKEVFWESSTTYYNRLAQRYGHGRILLAGDACHLFSSIGGLGMNTGFQDALGLAWRLAGIVRKRLHTSVLESYEQERRTLTQKLIASTDANTRLITRVDRDPEGSLRDWLPVMGNRQRMTQLPLHFSGLAQQYEEGLIAKNGGLLVGQMIPCFDFKLDGRALCSYDLIDGQHFRLIHRRQNSGHEWWTPWPQIKQILLEDGPGHAQAVALLGLQADEGLLLRPDGYVAARASLQDGNAFLALLRPILETPGSMAMAHAA